MLSIVLFSMILFSGSLIAYMSGSRQIMRAVPITIMAASVFLFVFGLLEVLYYGVIALNAAVIILYIIGVIWILRSNEKKDKLLDLIKAFGIVFVFVFVVSYLDKGMYAHSWDEFSHWADVVKAMFLIDDFATNPLAQSLYKDYPPGMALIQYLFMQENSIFHGKLYVEWRLFAAYHMVALSLLFPILEEKRLRKIESVSLVLIIVALCCFFYPGFFDELYIDPAVGVVATYVICLILFAENKDVVYDLAVIFGCIFLALLKDSGMLFACVNAAVYCFDKVKKPMFSKKNISSLVPLLATLGVKQLWKYDVGKEGIVGIHQQKIDFAEYISMLVRKDGNDYKQDVVNYALEAFFDNRFHIGPIAVSYFTVLLCLTIVSVFVILLAGRKEETFFLNSKAVIVLCVVAATTALYALFIGAIYAYRISDYEAVRLTSYERYMNTCFLYFTVVMVVAIFYCMTTLATRTSCIVIFAFVTLLFVDNLGITNYISRSNVEKGEEFRARYNTILGTVEEYCEDDDILCVLSRGDNGLDALVMRYYCRPVSVDLNVGYSLGGPSFEGDVWYTDILPSDYMDKIIEDSVSYVAVLKVEEDFVENYGELFENKDDIESNSLFKLDRSTRKLIRCR